jgi:hypothetical protein
VSMSANDVGFAAFGARLTNVSFENVDVIENAGPGFDLINSDLHTLTFGPGTVIAGNVGQGVNIEVTLVDDLASEGSAIEDVTFDGATISENGDFGVRIVVPLDVAAGGSVVFGTNTITDHVTGILIDTTGDGEGGGDDLGGGTLADTGPLLITFGATTIEGGDTGLVLSGLGLALTGGGGAVPGGTPIGGGTMPGDGVFGGSLGSLVFTGQGGDYIVLTNGALFHPGMPTVIDASNVTFDGLSGSSGLTAAQRDAIMDRVVEWNDGGNLGLVFLPVRASARTVVVPRDREFEPLRGKENTPGDTLYRLSDGLGLNPWGSHDNAFCFAYSLGEGSDEEERVICVEPAPEGGDVGPNDYLQDFWKGWQAARL